VIIYRPINGLQKACDGLTRRQERTKGVILKKISRCFEASTHESNLTMVTVKRQAFMPFRRNVSGPCERVR
jgi:hypothetical protein